jgi:GGDEF domain-containing protein
MRILPGEFREGQSVSRPPASVGAFAHTGCGLRRNLVVAMFDTEQTRRTVWREFACMGDRLGHDEISVSDTAEIIASLRRSLVKLEIEIATLRHHHLGDRYVSIGVSIGAALPRDGRMDLDVMMREADAAMYQAKLCSSGRTATVTAAFKPRRSVMSG